MACLLTAALVMGFLGAVSPVLEQKTAHKRYADFYRRQDYDVLYLGTSHVQNGFIPFELWNAHGIPSYNLSAAGCRIPTMYWQLKSALEQAKPKVVILDCAYLMDDKHNTRVIEYNHTIFDAMPMGLTRIRAVLDLFDDAQERLRFLFPFSVYHSRWNELTKADFEQTETHHYGYSVSFDREAASFPDIQTEEKAPAIENAATDYLYRIAELCRQEGIALCLTMIPFSTLEIYREEEAWVAEFAESRGIPFWNSKEILKTLEPATDFANFSEDNSHVNYGGALKITSALGRWLKERIALPDRREDAAYVGWDASAAAERAALFESVSKKPTLYTCFQLSAREDIETEIVLGSAACLEDAGLANALKHIGCAYQIAGEGETQNPRGVRMTLRSRDGYGVIQKDFSL